MIKKEKFAISVIAFGEIPVHTLIYLLIFEIICCTIVFTSISLPWKFSYNVFLEMPENKAISSIETRCNPYCIKSVVAFSTILFALSFIIISKHKDEMPKPLEKGPCFGKFGQLVGYVWLGIICLMNPEMTLR